MGPPLCPASPGPWPGLCHPAPALWVLPWVFSPVVPSLSLYIHDTFPKGHLLEAQVTTPRREMNWRRPLSTGPSCVCSDSRAQCWRLEAHRVWLGAGRAEGGAKAAGTQPTA